MDEAWRTGWSGGRFQVKETTGDVGVIAEGESLPSAIASAAAGLYYIMSPGPVAVGTARLWVSEEAGDLALAFARALQRLVVAFDVEGFIAGSALASVYRGERAKVTLELTGETFDALRHEQGVEVKAVTHHGLVVDPAAHRVEVLLDV